MSTVPADTTTAEGHPRSCRTVLAVVDLTPVSVEVLDRAAAAARCCDAELVAGHFCEEAVPVPVDSGMVGFPAVGVDVDRLVAAAERRLDDLLDSCGLAGVRRLVRPGVARSDIPRLAEEIGADLVVIGAVSRRGLGRLLGSTARAVVGEAPCDVLTVRLQGVE